jgi:hypothetical protein
VSESRCPACKKALDAATHFTKPGARPKPGDFTVCSGCGEILCFGEGMAVVPLGPRDRFDFEMLPEPARAYILSMQRLVREIREEQRPSPEVPPGEPLLGGGDTKAPEGT